MVKKRCRYKFDIAALAHAHVYIGIKVSTESRKDWETVGECQDFQEWK